MGSLASSASPLATSARAAVEGAVIAFAGLLLAQLFGNKPGAVAGARIGIGAAWAASVVSVSWLLWARDRSTKAFWYAFGGGMFLRALVLGVLAAWNYRREAVTMEALLLSYVFVLLAMLLTLETRHLRIR